MSEVGVGAPTVGTELFELRERSDLQRMPLGKSVAEWLGDEIVFGRIPPGSRLISTEISRQLNVSQTPVREAFRLLNGEGLVRLEEHRGAWVAEIRPEEVEDIYECRAYLQGLAARQSAERATEADRVEIRGALTRLAAAAEAGDRVTYFRLNLELHALLALTARNVTLAELTQRLGRRTLQLRFMAISLPGRLRLSIEGHTRMVEAIFARESDRAEELMRRMVRESGAAICAAHAKNLA